LRHVATSELYRRIGFVLQEVRLIHASVRENIALGRPSASLHEVAEAARLANIHERILALPRGYDSVIGEDAQLSGGELQRVSIARAVLLDPAVLVLDEATAAADAENEVAIQDALSRLPGAAPCSSLRTGSTPSCTLTILSSSTTAPSSSRAATRACSQARAAMRNCGRWAAAWRPPKKRSSHAEDVHSIAGR
jgi:hypothetical protein